MPHRAKKTFRRADRARPSLAAVLIVRDEARCIARCLTSVRPFVDRIVVLDTGSRDDTAAIAARHGGEVHHFAWVDDFSVARNRALDIADADWNLVLDADEAIAAGGAALRAWCKGPPRLGQLCIHSRFDAESGAGVGRNWITRLLPRGVRYEGRVHEQVVSALPRGRVPVEVDHDGYLDAQLAGKWDRNRPLLLLELGRCPGDPYLLFQLGKDAEMRGDHAEAATRYAAALAGVTADATWLHELVTRHLQALRRSGRVEEALAWAQDNMAAWRESPDFFFEVGTLALDRAAGDPARAVGHWLPLAQAAWERCLEIGERPELEGSVQGCGSALPRHNLAVVRSQLALFASARAA